MSFTWIFKATFCWWGQRRLNLTYYINKYLIVHHKQYTNLICVQIWAACADNRPSLFLWILNKDIIAIVTYWGLKLDLLTLIYLSLSCDAHDSYYYVYWGTLKLFITFLRIYIILKDLQILEQMQVVWLNYFK